MIVIEKLAKAYGAVRAIDGLDLTVNRGEIFGFLGPNGAGKTTTVRVLTTLTRPDTGRALIDGCDVVTQRLEVKRRFGVVQQHLSMDRELNVTETMELHARIRGMKAEVYRPQIDELLEYVERCNPRMVITDRHRSEAANIFAREIEKRLKIPAKAAPA